MGARHLNLILFMMAGLCASLSTHRHETGGATRAPASDPVIDSSFIENSVGKKFIYSSPKIPDGEPNCVAAALRGGGYLPAFAVNGTDIVYEHLLPICFRKKAIGEEPSRGDLGVEYTRRIPTLAHMVLFLGSDQIFERASPSNDEPFRYNSWNLIKQKDQRPGIDFEVWSYSPSKNCPLADILADFNKPDSVSLRAAAVAIDRGIFFSTASKTIRLTDLDLTQRILDNDKKLENTVINKDKFSFKESYGEYYRISFRSYVYKTLLRAPN